MKHLNQDDIQKLWTTTLLRYLATLNLVDLRLSAFAIVLQHTKLSVKLSMQLLTAV